MLSLRRLLIIRNRPIPPSKIVTPQHFFSSSSSSSSSQTKTILLIGCNGALGQSITSTAPPNTTLFGADLSEPQPSSPISKFIPISAGSVMDVTSSLRDGVKNSEFDAVICAAGGWIGDPPPGEDDDEMEYAESMELMLNMNLYPVIAGGLISMNHLKRGGLFLSIGATAALSPTPNMMSYGTSKAASHHFIQTLGTRKKGAKSKIMDAFEDRTSLAILPNVLDTPNNRKFMPSENFAIWTKTDDVAKQIWEWVEKPLLRPESGSLIKVLSKEGKGAVFHLVR